MMTEQELFERITLDPQVLAGKPVIKGTRLSVEYVLNLLAHGATVAEILEEYEGLKEEDIQGMFVVCQQGAEEHGVHAACA